MNKKAKNSNGNKHVTSLALDAKSKESLQKLSKELNIGQGKVLIIGLNLLETLMKRRADSERKLNKNNVISFDDAVRINPSFKKERLL